MGKWACSFGFAHADTVYMPWKEGQREIVFSFENNLTGYKVRFRFSNRYGVRNDEICSVRIGKESTALNIPVTVDKKEMFTVPAGKSVLSDEIEFGVKAGDEIWIRMELKRAVKPESGYGLDGVSVGYLEEMDVFTEQSPFVVVAFGDSITRMNTWTRPLTEELYRRLPGRISFSNKGLSGNRLIYDCMRIHHNAFGVSGCKRFPYDVLEIPGLSHVIFALGTNDLGHPGEPGCPVEEKISAQDFEGAAESLVLQLHEKGVKVYGSTITGRALNPPYWTVEKETERKEINEWIRNSGVFDAVLDFEKALERDDSIPGMAEEYDSGDGLHPSEAGGAAIMKSIPLQLFGS